MVNYESSFMSLFITGNNPALLRADLYSRRSKGGYT